MSSEKRIFFIDGHAMVYRAHYAFINRPLMNSKGQNVSAISGFVRSVWDLIIHQKPSYIGVIFDPKGGTFRSELYEEYKAQRDAQPEDITLALPYIIRIMEGMRIPVEIIPNFEADDVIGTLAKKAEKEGFQVFMVTPDKDYAQLVSENIFQYKPARFGNDIEILGVEDILKKWEIKRIDQVIDILGLMGDSVDNIPGLPGVGPKTAVKLIDEFDNIENVLNNADKIAPFLKKHAQKGDIFITQLETNLNALYNAIDTAHKLGMYIIMNPSPVCEFDMNILAEVDLLVMNETEALLLSKIQFKNEKDLIKIHRKLKAKATIVTLGGDGAYLIENNEVTYQAAIPTNVVDTTCAGDTFTGALAYRQANGYEIKESLKFAATASSIAVSRKGAAQSIPNLHEVLDIYKEEK